MSVSCCLPSDEEVLWLHVSVYQMLGVDVFYPHQELYGYQEHRLENEINIYPALSYLLVLSPLMKISAHKYRINLLSLAPAVPSLARCISHRVRSSKFQAHPRTQSQAAYKTWGIMLSEQTRSLYQENPNLYSKCNCGALDFIGSSLIATCSLL